MGCWMRGRVRERLGIAGSPVQDWWIHCCCPLCAMFQEFSTLSQRLDNFGVRVQFILLLCNSQHCCASHPSSSLQQFSDHSASNLNLLQVAETLRSTYSAAKDVREMANLDGEEGEEGPLLGIPKGRVPASGMPAQSMDRGAPPAPQRGPTTF